MIIQELYSIEAEENLLGSILIDPVIINKLDVEPLDFYIIKNQWLFETARQLKDYDIFTLAQEISKAHPDVKQDYIVGLVSKTPTSLHADKYAQIIKDYARRRKIMSIANEIANFANDPLINLDEGVARSVSDMVITMRISQGAEQIGSSVSRLYDHALDMHNNPRQYYGIPTGFTDWDNITGGMQRKTVVIIAGEPGIGKSLFAMQLCAGMQKHAPGAVYEMEMDSQSVVERLVSGQGKIPTKNIDTGRMTANEWEVFTKTLSIMAKMQIHISDSTAWTTTSLRADLARLKEQYKIEWFMLDYMALLNDTVGKDGNEKSAFISRQIHNICKDLDLAGLIVHSINKEGMAGTALKQHLSGSGSIAFDADQICFLDKTDQQNVLQLRWDKVRNGESGGKMKIVKLQGFPAFGEYIHTIQ